MKVLFLYGATASGKSDLALDLAHRYQGQIVNCDSIQIYKHLNIGSAKPGAEEQGEVPHHLFDFVEYPESFDAASYRRMALDTLKVLEKKACPLAIVVGGTGFYFQALEKGMYSAPDISPEITSGLDKDLELDGLSLLYQEMIKKDPILKNKISENDSYRTLRHLALIRSGHLPSQLEKEFDKESFPYPLFKVNLELDRESSSQRILQRVEKMLDKGFIDEVEGLRKAGYSDWPPMKSVGYLQVGEYLDGVIESKEALIEAIHIKTRQLAKRQRTWFRRDIEAYLLSDVALQKKELLSEIQKFINSGNSDQRN
ncbi:MAG: tRNA (adenosine(37)-N6)-dimethylallyltransferase MiaA [Bdellovibrionales bacterium]